MPRLYKDSWGNIYKKSAFGSYSDGFSSYAKVAASPGYGILGLTVIAAIVGNRYSTQAALVCFALTALICLIAAIVNRFRHPEVSGFWSSGMVACLICASAIIPMDYGLSLFFQFVYCAVFAMIFILGNIQAMIICTVSGFILSWLVNQFIDVMPSALHIAFICIPLYICHRAALEKPRMPSVVLSAIYIILCLLPVLPDFMAGGEAGLSALLYLSDNIMLIFTILIVIIGLILKKPGIAVYLTIPLVLAEYAAAYYLEVNNFHLGVNFADSNLLSSILTLVAAFASEVLNFVIQPSSILPYMTVTKTTEITPDMYTLIALLAARGLVVFVRRMDKAAKIAGEQPLMNESSQEQFD